MHCSLKRAILVQSEPGAEASPRRACPERESVSKVIAPVPATSQASTLANIVGAGATVHIVGNTDALTRALDGQSRHSTEGVRGVRWMGRVRRARDGRRAWLLLCVRKH